MIKKLYWFLFVYDLNEPAAPPAAGNKRSWTDILRKDVCCLVLFSYILMSCNTVIPVLADVVAHTFWEKEHFAAEHQQFGKNHVDLQIQKIEKQAAKDKNAGTAKTGTEDSTHILIIQQKVEFLTYRIIKQTYPPYQQNEAISFPDHDYPPPRV